MHDEEDSAKDTRHWAGATALVWLLSLAFAKEEIKNNDSHACKRSEWGRDGRRVVAPPCMICGSKQCKSIMQTQQMWMPTHTMPMLLPAEFC
jgi:alkanesulfonate monooxygenase SsuD/methylene tetrahydromethanopterin reductase-like flavin-dependent oxidoreductase (luciferase family)